MATHTRHSVCKTGRPTIGQCDRPATDDATSPLNKSDHTTRADKTAQQRLEWTQRQDKLLALPDFFVLMVESRTWGFFRPTPNGFDPNCRPAPPNVTADDSADRDAVLVGSDLGMRQIVSGHLPFERALEERIIALDADRPRYDKLLGAWSGAYPKVGFSRFVCA